MSDLISRGELLKRFLVNKDGHRIPERDCDNIEVTVSIKDVKTIIKEQPTAYDIDKVVEELERYQLGNLGCQELDEIIEIVKQGGVADDKTQKCDGCTWQYDLTDDAECGHCTRAYSDCYERKE